MTSPEKASLQKASSAMTGQDAAKRRDRVFDALENLVQRFAPSYDRIYDRAYLEILADAICDTSEEHKHG